MAVSKSIHWMAPTVMISSFVCGLVLAAGHHLFNENLRGEPVPTGDYHALGGLAVSKQQFNSSMGIGFAFFVRTFLTVAASATYVQVLWSSVKKGQAPTLAELDWAFAGLDNFLGLFNFKRGKRYPVLILLAIIFWCVPFATIFPPATLLVELRSTLPLRELQVPLYDFTSINYAAPMENRPFGGPLDWWRFEGPSQPLQTTALAALSLDTILPTSSPAPNASWSQDFWGPAIQCNDAEESDRERTFVNIWNAYNATRTGTYGYLSWVPWSWDDAIHYEDMDAIDSARELPFVLASPYNDYERHGPSPSLVAGDGPASLWLAVIPQAPQLSVVHLGENDTTSYWGHYWEAGSLMANCPFQRVEQLTDRIDSGCLPANASFSPAMLFQDATMLRFDLRNTSYSVTLKYTNGVQNLTVLSSTTGYSPVVNSSAYFLSQKSYATEPEATDCATFLTDPIPDAEGVKCAFDLDAMRLRSYQSISAAFNQLILGGIYHGNSLEEDIVSDTDVMRTVLSQTSELAFLRNWHIEPVEGDEGDGLEALVSQSSAWAFQGLSNPQLPLARKDLKATLEELFQNLTISLLAEPYFRPNFSSPFAPSQHTNVTLETWQNFYSYHRATLWIAYGLAVGATALAVAGGLVAIVSNGASYSDNFSTMLRVSRTARLGAEVQGRDADGQDPLPEYLKHAHLDLRQKFDSTVSTYELLEVPSEQQIVVGKRTGRSTL